MGVPGKQVAQVLTHNVGGREREDEVALIANRSGVEQLTIMTVAGQSPTPRSTHHQLGDHYTS